jgi:hypothetical protein
VWQPYRSQGGLVLALGDEDVDKLIAWRDDKGVTFPMLLEQDTYDAHVDPQDDSYYALEIATDKQGLIRFAAHGATGAQVAAWFEQLVNE